MSSAAPAWTPGRLDGCDCGNERYSKYAPTVIYDDVFVPWERVFLCGELEFAGEMVIHFSAFHRQSHGGCKSGKIDCMTGAALTMMDYNGTEKASHLKEKIIDMIHRAETLYGCSLAASYEGKKMPSGNYFIDPVLANASKIHEGKEMAEATRLLIDIAGGFVADLPSDRDFENSGNRRAAEEVPEGGRARFRWRTGSRCSAWSKRWPWRAPTPSPTSMAAARRPRTA